MIIFQSLLVRYLKGFSYNLLDKKKQLLFGDIKKLPTFAVRSEK